MESPKVSHLVFSQTRGLEEYLADGAKSPRIRVMYERSEKGVEMNFC